MCAFIDISLRWVRRSLVEDLISCIFWIDWNCTEQSFITKSGIQRLASKYGFIVANPDTCPRRIYGVDYNLIVEFFSR